MIMAAVDNTPFLTQSLSSIPLILVTCEYMKIYMEFFHDDSDLYGPKG